jgi:hypothetical protein
MGTPPHSTYILTRFLAHYSTVITTLFTTAQNPSMEEIKFNKKTLAPGNNRMGKPVMGDDVYISLNMFLYNINNVGNNFKGEQ